MPTISLFLIALAATAQQRPPLRLVREFSLDAATGVSFGVIGGMDLGPDGAIAAVDNGNGVIYRFTPAGKLRDSLGHKGQRGDIRFRPRVQGFGFDHAGRLLALVSNAGSTSPVVDVFSADGTFLGTVRPAEDLRAFVIRGNRAIGLSETADGEHVIHVYRIE